jgi:hypothetical protein
MFEHRLGGLLGLSVGQVLDLPESELIRWRKYWSEEPWGPYRDNVHTAMMIAELLRPHLAKGAKIEMEAFMLRHPDEVKAIKMKRLQKAFEDAAAPKTTRRVRK